MNDVKIDIFSPETQEIILRPPHKLIKWGMSIIFLIFILLIIGSMKVSIPEKITGDIIIYFSDDSLRQGIISIKPEGIGKLEPGQTINIKLNSFPHFEYGVVKATVPEESLNYKYTEEGLEYTLSIPLPDTLVTTNNNLIDFRLPMVGQADIITHEMKLIDHLLNPIIATI